MDERLKAIWAALDEIVLEIALVDKATGVEVQMAVRDLLLQLDVYQRHIAAYNASHATTSTAASNGKVKVSAPHGD